MFSFEAARAFSSEIYMPKKDAHKQFDAWAREYGPVYSLILGTQTLIVLNSDQAVNDLLDKKSGIYSDRQDMYVGQQLCSGGLRVLIMVSQPHGENRAKLTTAALRQYLENGSQDDSFFAEHLGCQVICPMPDA
jgi:hypothetical protein